MKNLFYPLLFATALVSAACSNDLENDANVTDPSNKTAISFVGQANMTRAGFTANTQIAMHIRSTNGKDASKIRETRTFAYASKDATQSETSFSTIDAPTDANVRYWDDAYGRDANLSVFAVAIPEEITPTNNKKSLLDLLSGGEAWNAGALEETISWKVSTDQTETTIANEDLTFSNNISASGNGGAKAYNYSTSAYDKVQDGCLQFRLQDANLSEGPGKFDQGNLKFTHALSRITVNLIKGTGYGSSPFAFDTNTNVKILGVPTTGSFDIENGVWDSSDDTGINTMAPTTTATGATYSLLAQVLPGYVITKGDDHNVLEFTIDDNKYFITQDMMFKALDGKSGITENTGTAITMEKGRNYVFNITVGKSKIINVTATLEPFVDVTAEDKVMDNSHITLGLYTNGKGKACTNFDLYRLNDKSDDINTGASTDINWEGNYTDKATLTKNGSKWETEWFFENNKSFYHFRTVNEGTTIEGSDDDKVDDYFVITSGKDTAACDYHWGAPFKSSTTSPIQYSKTDGYTSFLSPAIGATNTTINLTELHMMSNIKVVLQTTKTSNAVSLEANDKQCEVTLTYFYPTGQVKMGNGLVTPTGTLTDSIFMAPAKGIDKTDGTYNKTGAFSFAVVPQALIRTSGTNVYVGITIKTPDDNQYYVVKSLAEIAATSNGGSQNQGLSAINFWYPNHSYTYTFTLTKAGIKNVTCTVEDWTYVTATNKDISLED